MSALWIGLYAILGIAALIAVRSILRRFKRYPP